MRRVINRTQSVCPVCLKTIKAERIMDTDHKIYMQKQCQEHGSFRTLIWEGDLASYYRWNQQNEHQESPVNPEKTEKHGCPNDCGMCTEHLSKGCCMLLELTNRCNLQCPVCFASAGENPPSDLSLEEIGRQFDFLMNHGGPFNIQLSGGEPTMRDDLPAIIQMGREKGFTFFQLNTNGIRLAEEEGYAAELKEAGLNTVFLQFDGVTDEVYQILRGRPLLEQKQRAIRNCGEAGLGVVLVPVIAPGVNENQVGDILKFAMDRMPEIRGVHFQPISYFGRCSLDAEGDRITIPRMLRLIEAQTDGQMKAGDFAGGGAENPYCSFHASYMKGDSGALRALKKKSTCCCCTSSDDSREFVARQWSGQEERYEMPADGPLSDTSGLDAFLEEARKRTLAVSGMIFQDAYNFDLDRVRRCYICELDAEYGMVPFCAYNLTNRKGEYLYRK
ncbi:MAG: radical SAM protein [Lachnospiraceae bacterium]|nr:radical SAM protein [Lachnospiraceae bacterium]